MLTPVFEVHQDESHVLVVIEAKYGKLSDAEIFFHEHDFTFNCRPYYLRLTFPRPVESEALTPDFSKISNYDCDSGKFSIRLRKKNRGEYFEDLDLLSTLLSTRDKRKTATPNIEVLESSTAESDDFEEFDWHIEQALPVTEDFLSSKNCYGFANKKSGTLDKILEDFGDLIDLKNPELKTNDERHLERIEQENNDFSDDHYLADLYDNDYIESIIDFKPWWDSLNASEIIYSDQEKFIIKELPRREYLLTSNESRLVTLSLVDLIYSYAYQNRTTLGDNNVESGWTIRKLSPTLSWLEVHSSLKLTLVSVIRRSLTYPFYRHWSISIKILEDLERIFKLGRKCLLKCLLDIRSLFIDSDSRYVLNDLYIIDYCVWIQKTDKKLFTNLAESLKEVRISKSDLGFDLEELELAAEQVQMEENLKVEAKAESSIDDVKQVCNNFEKMNLSAIKEEKEEKNSSTESHTEGEESGDESDSDACGDYYLDSDDSEKET